MPNLNTVVENDANALATYARLFWDRLELEELTLENGVDHTPTQVEYQPEDFLTVLVTDRGVGAGLYLKGARFTGHDGLAGKLGHFRIDRMSDALACRCGKRGCVEAYASPHGLLKRLNPIFTNLAAAAKARDSKALEIFAEGGTTLGIALSYAINIVGPRGIAIFAPPALVHEVDHGASRAYWIEGLFPPPLGPFN